MAIECGIVGMPNVGKSTLFNALTSSHQAAAENYPFCTIDPNVGVVEMPDERLKKIAAIFKPEKIIPTTVSFVDIAGLVKGASKGEGLGNQFLGHIKGCQAIAHVVRCFEDPNIIHVEGSVDPIRDVEVIETELMLADLATVEKREERLAKLTKSGDKDAIFQLDFVKRLKKSLEDGVMARLMKADAKEWESVKDLHLITQKPLMYVANMSEEFAAKGKELENPFYIRLLEYAKKVGAHVIPVCAKIESELDSLDETEKEVFMKDLGIEEPGLNKVIRYAYETLGLQTYFTAGPKELRAWTIGKGWKAPQAAGVIHTDFERGFICSETYNYEDLIAKGSEQKVKEAGLMRTEGKEYTVKDGDLLHFRFNV